jgi:hypothetical protein
MYFILYTFVLSILISLIAGSLLFANPTGITRNNNNNILMLDHIQTAQAQLSSSPLRGIENYKSIDKAGDAAATGSLTTTIDTMTADGNCEVCMMVKYVPGTTGVAAIAFKSPTALDLTNIKRIVFFVKGELGGENLKFVALGKPSSSLLPPTPPFTNLHFGVVSQANLTNNWQRYQLSFSGADLTGITDPFGIIVNKGHTSTNTAPSPNKPPLDDSDSNHVIFFLKGVTVDTNTAINPLPHITAPVSTANTTKTLTSAPVPTNTTATNTTAALTAKPRSTTAITAPANSTNTTDIITQPINSTIQPSSEKSSAKTTSPSTNPIVSKGNTVQPLNAEINTNYTNGTAPHTIQFKAKATGGNQPYSFSWNFDDGSNNIDNAKIISHTFFKPGNYNVILTLTDSNQGHQTASRLVTLRQTTANVNNKPLTTGSFYTNGNKTQNIISLDNGVNSPAHTQQLKNQGIANSTTTTIKNTRTTTGVTKIQNPSTFNNATKSIISNSSPTDASNTPGNNNPILKLTNNKSLTTINTNQHPNNTKYQTQLSSINNTLQRHYSDQKQSSTTASPSSATSNAVQRYPFLSPPQQQLQNQPQTLLPPQQQQLQNQPQTLLPPQQQQLQNQQRINQQLPIANAGISQTVYGGTIVTLDGKSSYDPDNYAGGNANNYINKGIAAYQWTQIPTTPGVRMPVVITLQGANTATPTFVSPILQYDTILAFSLKVMDSDGAAVSGNPAIVYVYVKHNPSNSSPTTSGNTPGITVNPQEQQQQQLQPLVPNNNFVPAAPSQPNSPSPTFPPPAPQIGSLNTQNGFPSGR